MVELAALAGVVFQAKMQVRLTEAPPTMQDMLQKTLLQMALQKDVKFKFPMELVLQSQSQCILKPLEAKQSRSKRFISLLKKTSTSPLPT